MDKSIFSSELQRLRNHFKDFESEIFDLCLTLIEAPNALIWRRLVNVLRSVLKKESLPNDFLHVFIQGFLLKLLIDVQLHEVENPCGSNFRVLIDLCSDFPKDDQSESFQIASDFVDLKLNDLYSQVSTLSVSVREHQPKFLEYVVTLNRLFEWNVGNLLHSRSFRELIGIILRLLVASSSVIEGSVTGDTFTGNGIHPIIGHLLRTLLTLLTKFQKRGFLETLGTSEWKDIYMSAARITAREPFVNEHRVIGGIVMAHAIHFTGYSDWKNALFSHHEIQLVSSAPSVYLESETSELCDFGRLCLLRGIFHVYAAEDPFFDQLVSSDCTKEQHLFMVLHEKVSLIARNARKSFERMLAYDALSDSFARVSHLSNSSTTAFRAEINHTLLIIINNWEDPVDTLEHKLRDLFITVLGLIVKDTELLDSLFSRLTSMNAHEKVRFDLLSIVASKIGLPTVLRLSPTVFHDALNLLPVVPNPVRIAAFINQFLKMGISIQDKSELPTLFQGEEWWSTPISKALVSSQEHVRRIINEAVLYPLFKTKTNAFIILSKAMENRRDNAHYFWASLAVLKAAKSTNQLCQDWIRTGDETIEGTVSSRFMERLMRHSDISLRTEGFSLLCESTKGVSDFQNEELRLLLLCVESSMDIQTPHFRYNLISSLKKAFVRIKRVVYAQLKSKESLQTFQDKLQLDPEHNKENMAEALKESKLLTQRLSMKANTLRLLYDLILDNLFPGTCLQRSSMALDLFSSIQDWNDSILIEKDTPFSLENVSRFPRLMSPKAQITIFQFIIYSESAPDRAKAFDIYRRILTSSEDTPLVSRSNLVKNAEFLLNSLHASHVESGVVITRLISIEYAKSKHSLFYDMVKILESHIEIASTDLLRSSSTNPLSSYFSVLDSILLEMDCTLLADSDIPKRLLDVSLKAFDIVMAVCANESPEGNLPASFRDIDAKAQELISTSRSSKDLSPGEKSQLILHHCFRTIKDATAALATCVERFPLPSKNSDGFSLVETIGETLCTLLGVMRHSGAFVAVSESFERVVQRLLSSEEAHLIQLCIKWLDKFMKQITEAGASITRRSGGLPKGILAIVGKTDYGRKFLLGNVMKELLCIAKLPVTPNRNTDTVDMPQVHAVNVVKAIIHDTNSSGEVPKYFSEAFEICIDGFSSVYFPIRNGSMMLFSALINKMFGAKKLSPDSITSAKIGGKAFFTKYPSLFSLFLATMKAATMDLSMGSFHPALFPMLLTLSYLRTSDDDRSDHHFSLSAFRGLIIKCLFCPIYKARRLAARILFQLHVQSDMEDILIQLVTPENMAHGNRAHGALLFIHQLIASKKDDAASDVCQMAVMRLEELQWILSRGSRILQELYYEVCLEAIDLNKLSNASALTIRNFAIDDVLNCEGKHYSLNHPQTRIVLSGLLMDNRDSLETLIRLLNHQEYEVSLTTIDWISSRSFDGSILISLVDVLIKILVTDYVYNDLARGAGNLLANIVSSKDILLTTKQITSIQDILKDRKRRHMMDVLLPLAGSVVSNGTVTVDKLQLMSLLDIYLQLLSEFNREEERIPIRHAVVASIRLSKAVSLPMKIFESHHISLLFHLDKLMEDEEPEIRDAASEIVLELFGEDELLDRSYTRVLLYSYLFVQTFSKHGLGLLRSQLLGRLYAIGSIHSVIRNQLTCHQKLYAAEKANPRREHFIDLLLTFDILRTLSREDGCIRKHLISLVDTIWDALQCLTDLGWWSGQPIVFNALVQIVEGIRLMGDSVGEKHIRIRDGIKTTPLMHPILVRLIDDHQSVEKHFLLTI